MGPVVGAAMTFKAIFGAVAWIAPSRRRERYRTLNHRRLGMPLSMTRNPTHFAQRKSV